MLLTVLVYAMACGVRSSRQIERSCSTDVAFRIICASDVPDHTVLARFRQRHEAALADLLTETLRLAARLGMVRLGIVAFDGTKIAADASRQANRSEAGLRRIAQQHLAEAAATDRAEDEQFGNTARDDELPPKLRDRSGRGRRIRQALDEIERGTAQAQAREKAAEQAAADYQQQAADPGPARGGRAPAGVDRVAVARARWERAQARAQQRIDDWHHRAARLRAQGRQPKGREPIPADQHCRVTVFRAAYEQAAAAAEHAARQTTTTPPPGPATIRANLTDPDSRLMKTRNGWLQGYNCQTALSADQFILDARATQDANDLNQFEPTATAVTDLARHLSQHTGRTDLHPGTLIGDAGYDSDHNLTCNGPDRLIANAKSRDLHHQDTPARNSPPPEHATARETMNHRLHTEEGHTLYKRRSPTVEAANSWLKDRRGLRRFNRRGLTAAHSELRFAAAVTNLLRIRTLATT